MRCELYLLLAFIYKVQTKPLTSPDNAAQDGEPRGWDDPAAAWSPPGSLHMSAREFHSTYGLGEKTYYRMTAKAKKLRELLSRKENRPPPDEPLLSSIIFDDVIFPEQMMDHFIQILEDENSRRRKRRKRKVINFSVTPYMKWPNARVPYVFNTMGTTAASLIQQAMQHWESETCIRFYELNRVIENRPDYLVYQNSQFGCFAYYGRTGGAQIVNIGANCLTWKGYAVHEIGHALAFYHEQSRYDRDSYVQILTDNIQEGREHNFVLYDRTFIDTLGVPYDFSSVMHYSSKAFSVNKVTTQTLRSKDPLYQNTMGQRLSLSFFDVKAANIAYCSDRCVSSALSCQRGGYPDPNDCSRCKCPDGFTGNQCESVARSSGVGCPSTTGLVQVTSTTATCIRVGPYVGSVSCNWLLQTYTGSRIKFWFQDGFEVLCSGPTGGPVCYDYVQVTYKDNLLKGGPRFCCGEKPGFNNVVSDYNEILVIFRTPEVRQQSYHGFTMCFAQDGSVLPPQVHSTTWIYTSTPSWFSTSSFFRFITTNIGSLHQTNPPQSSTNVFSTTRYPRVLYSTTPSWTSTVWSSPRTTTYQPATNRYDTTTNWWWWWSLFTTTVPHTTPNRHVTDRYSTGRSTRYTTTSYPRRTTRYYYTTAWWN